MSNEQGIGLKAGEWVQVRSKEEILATLDANGRLDEMPFMPEMLKYCGARMMVGKRAHKTCDPALGIGGRKMANTVICPNIRCNGAAHDGCEAGCLIFWKDAWLKRIDAKPAAEWRRMLHRSQAAPAAPKTSLHSSIKIPPAAGQTEPTYVCQNTQVKFATEPLHWWDVRQYVEDYTSGNVKLSAACGRLAVFHLAHRCRSRRSASALRCAGSTISIQRAIGRRAISDAAVTACPRERRCRGKHSTCRWARSFGSSRTRTS